MHFNSWQKPIQVQWLLSVITLVSLVFMFGMKIKTTNFDIINSLGTHIKKLNWSGPHINLDT